MKPTRGEPIPVDLILLCRAGNQAAWRKLLRRIHPLIVWTRNKVFVMRGMSFDADLASDLDQVGRIIVARSVDPFDVERATPFGMYCAPSILRAMHLEVDEQRSLYGWKVRDETLDPVRAALASGATSAEEIAAHTGLSYHGAVAGLDAIRAYGEDIDHAPGGLLPLSERIAAADEPADERLHLAQLSAFLRDRVSDDDRVVMLEHFDDGKTLEQIGRERGVTREAIRIRIKRAVERATVGLIENFAEAA